MNTPGAEPRRLPVRVPRSVEQLQRIWHAFPVAGTWFLMQAGEWPTLTEAFEAYEKVIEEGEA